jgi:hypothetical protein
LRKLNSAQQISGDFSPVQPYMHKKVLVQRNVVRLGLRPSLALAVFFAFLSYVGLVLVGNFLAAIPQFLADFIFIKKCPAIWRENPENFCIMSITQVAHPTTTHKKSNIWSQKKGIQFICRRTTLLARYWATVGVQ